MSAESKRIGARLREERKKRRMTVEQLAEVFRDQASDRERRRMPKLKDLARTIRGHEAGEHPPGPLYRMRYADAFGVDEVELFGGEPVKTPPWHAACIELNGQFTPDDQERLNLAAQQPARLDARVIESLSAILAALRRTEDATGSGPMVETATSHLRLILWLLKEARGPLVDQLAATASDASQFAGWLYTATGAHDAAGPRYDQSLRLGLQAANADLAATALSMRGHLAWVTGDLTTMAALSRSAADLAQATGTRAIAIQQRGRALALMGDRRAALDAIGKAEEVLAVGDGRDDPDLLYFYGPAYLTMQRGLILGYLAQTPAEHARSADLITAGLDGLPSGIRDSEWVAWYRVQAGRARAAGGEVGEGVSDLWTALEIVSATGSAKTRAEIVAVHHSMAEKWPGDSDVADLGDALR